MKLINIKYVNKYFEHFLYFYLIPMINISVISNETTKNQTGIDITVTLPFLFLAELSKSTNRWCWFANAHRRTLDNNNEYEVGSCT